MEANVILPIKKTVAIGFKIVYYAIIFASIILVNILFRINTTYFSIKSKLKVIIVKRFVPMIVISLLN